MLHSRKLLPHLPLPAAWGAAALRACARSCRSRHLSPGPRGGAAAGPGLALPDRLLRRPSPLLPLARPAGGCSPLRRAHGAYERPACPTPPGMRVFPALSPGPREPPRARLSGSAAPLQQGRREEATRGAQGPAAKMAAAPLRPPRFSRPRRACARRVPVTGARRGVRVHAPPCTRTVMAAPSWVLAAARAGVRPWRLPAVRRCGGAPAPGAPEAGALPQQTEERPGTGTAATGPRQVRARRGGAGPGQRPRAVLAGPPLQCLLAGLPAPCSAAGPERAACFPTGLALPA